MVNEAFRETTSLDLNNVGVVRKLCHKDLNFKFYCFRFYLDFTDNEIKIGI